MLFFTKIAFHAVVNQKSLKKKKKKEKKENSNNKDSGYGVIKG